MTLTRRTRPTRTCRARTCRALALLPAITLALAGCGDDLPDDPDVTDTTPDAPPDPDGSDGGDADGTDADTPDRRCLGLWPDPPPQVTPPTMPAIGPDRAGLFFTVSSPRAFDLDGDGCPDFVFGVGVEREQYAVVTADYGRVIAIDGASGDVLWTVVTPGDVFASAVTLTAADGTLRVVTAGREGTMVSIVAATGVVDWFVDPTSIVAPPQPYNFYSPLLVEDVNADGVPELVNVYGGDASAQPAAPRDPSWVVLVDGETGELLGYRQTPDDAESYTSPVAWRTAARDGVMSTSFLFGTGGETLPGSLWLGTVDDLVAETHDGDWATEVVAGTRDRGVIAPPLVVDADGDGTLDLVVVDFGGRVVVLDGGDLADELWSVAFAGEESNVAAGVARLGEGRLGLMLTHNTGVFPMYTGSTHRLFELADGTPLDSWGSSLPFAFSPLAVDLTGDGVDAWIAGSTSVFAPSVASEVRVVDTVTQVRRTFTFPFGMAATPLVHVAPGHDQLELALVGFTMDPDDFMANPPSWLFRRVALGASAPASITWGAYLGTCGDGRLECE